MRSGHTNQISPLTYASSGSINEFSPDQALRRFGLALGWIMISALLLNVIDALWTFRGLAWDWNYYLQTYFAPTGRSTYSPYDRYVSQSFLALFNRLPVVRLADPLLIAAWIAWTSGVRWTRFFLVPAMTLRAIVPIIAFCLTTWRTFPKNASILELGQLLINIALSDTFTLVLAIGMSAMAGTFAMTRGVSSANEVDGRNRTIGTLAIVGGFGALIARGILTYNGSNTAPPIWSNTGITTGFRDSVPWAYTGLHAVLNFCSLAMGVGGILCLCRVKAARIILYSQASVSIVVVCVLVSMAILMGNSYGNTSQVVRYFNHLIFSQIVGAPFDILLIIVAIFFRDRFFASSTSLPPVPLSQ